MNVSALNQGLVVRSTAGFVDVLIGGQVVQCRMRGRLKNAPRTTDICVIGDQVVVDQPDDRTRVVVEVLPRNTRFSRRQPIQQWQGEKFRPGSHTGLARVIAVGRELANIRWLLEWQVQRPRPARQAFPERPVNAG